MIIASAIMFYSKEDLYLKYPKVITARRHADIYEQMLGLDYQKNMVIEGFWTNTDKFLDRYDAKELAYNCDQITEEQYYNTGGLYSEDIWPDE